MRLIDSIFKILPKSPTFWGIFWGVWAITLWFLSSRHPQVQNGSEIPHFDKILHFGYFAIGGFAISYALISHSNRSTIKQSILCLTIGTAIGALDEYHQSFTPSRSGNDPLDWTADILGTAAGIATFLWLNQRNKSNS